MGTAQYLSPEQAKGAMAGPASDVYALGMVAYECLAGRRPFEGASPCRSPSCTRTRCPTRCPPTSRTACGTLVSRMLAKDPEERIRGRRRAAERRGGRARRACRRSHRRTSVRRRSCVPRIARPRRRPSRGEDRRSLRPGTPLPAVDGPVAPDPARRGAGAHRGRGRGPGGRGSRVGAVRAGSTPEQTTALAVQVAAEEYLGRPVSEVEAELTSLGVSVQLRALRTATAPDGAVLAVGPTGELSPGQAVTVTHAVPCPLPRPSRNRAGIAATAGPRPAAAASAPGAPRRRPPLRPSPARGPATAAAPP